MKTYRVRTSKGDDVFIDADGVEYENGDLVFTANKGRGYHYHEVDEIARFARGEYSYFVRQAEGEGAA